MALILSILFAVQMVYSAVVLTLDQSPDPVAPEIAGVRSLQSKKPAEPDDPESAEKLSYDLLERPLFWDTRRPGEAGDELPLEQGPTGPDNLRNISLLGVFGNDEVGGVVIQAQGRTQRVLLNEELAGWKIVRINEREVVLERNGEVRSLFLEAETR